MIKLKHILSLSIIVFLASCAQSQFPYSSKDKKAVKLFEKAQKAPRESVDPETQGPNYKEGIVIVEKAIEEDPDFWEAHLLAAEFYERTRKYPEAISHYESVLKLNPNSVVTVNSYFYVSALQLALGRYDDALWNVELFIRNPNASEGLLSSAHKVRESAFFAKNAIKNPKPFEPQNVGPGINTGLPEYFPTLTVDGKTLLFTRRIPDSRVKYFGEQEDFYVSGLVKNEWGQALAMPPNVNTLNNEGAPSIAADGKTLIFVACSDESGTYYGENRTGKGSCDLFITRKIGNRWTNPVNLPGEVNTSNWETQPSLSSDGKTLYFIRGIKNRTGQNADIYVSNLRDDGTWGPGQRLPNYINTPDMEESVHIHPDGRTLYFASRGHVGMGGSDLFVTRLDDNGNWSKPENLGYPINTIYDENSLMVNATGEIAFFASDREGGYGGLDIYYFDLPQEFRPVTTLYFDGLVFDSKTKKPLPGFFELTDLSSGKTVIISEADRIDGSFMVPLPLERDYAIQVTYPGYFPYSLNFNLRGIPNQKSYHIDIPLNPETSADENLLANVFFDLNKSTLRPESKVELNKFASYLKSNPKIKIELGGHTDSRGNKDDNLKLSSDRAKSVLDYLIQCGVSSESLSYKGYGSMQPIVSDEEISKLAKPEEKESAHQKNRRTVYKVIP
jgi:outer membrane protein OmpA-like peptidoglycan-associated protein/Tol biopolymer transport system component